MGFALSGVLVLGMHRSGTSVAARAVNLIGVPFGRGRLVPVTEANPDGHWESWELQDINNEVLGTLGGSWAGPPSLEPGWEDRQELEVLRTQARSTWNWVHSEDHWVWKDPRTCITLPFWRAVADLGGPTILMYRHPAEVAASLARRDGFSEPVSLGLWERYNRDALNGSKGRRVLVTSYDRLVGDPTRWVHEVRDFLSESGVTVGSRQDLMAAAASVRPDRRSQPAPPGPHRRLTKQQDQLVDALRQMEGVPGEMTAADLGEPTPGLDCLLEEHGRAYAKQLALEAELARARSQLGHVINRTRVKVLAYRIYRRSPLKHWTVELGGGGGRDSGT